ncbi:helix-turn-helix domain-containing protein [Escherichia coli]|jgi:DNA-binding transcriptional MocR family regulator|uniref:Transcriptional regulator n=1 Tax=Escherichia coli TaxID=562 RepID=A0A0B1JSJ1_ECOLX|nr:MULTISPECIES: transcriptional regulator [Enterobacteriaceae]EHY2111805.1 helix-turn-helix domain-containing protein [Escherichia coli O157]EJT2829668.1 helix-turn-helix domain-containing protein [Shigella boydii]EKF4352489.1 helix-turn-helix domain-containing protein [Escherichia coli O136]ANP05814.1 transcriptional regulator [Escherichia coli]EEQ1627359.1 helix-turn-helix domain-containing protein [Escherichia coli]
MINQPTFTKYYNTFDNISKIYSNEFPEGKVLDLLHIVLYYRFLSYQENGLNCYESHETLAKIFKSSASTIKRKINDLKEMGLLETSPHPEPYISSLIYNALPLTDAHITPPGESSLPDPSEKENESNEILNVSEIIVEEETQESEFPERPEIFTWLLSLDKKKPPHEETEDFVKRALDSKNIYLEKQAFHDLIISLREKSEIYDSIPF